VLEGKAVVRVVDIEGEQQGVDALEAGMRSLNVSSSSVNADDCGCSGVLMRTRAAVIGKKASSS